MLHLFGYLAILCCQLPCTYFVTLLKQCIATRLQSWYAVLQIVQHVESWNITPVQAIKQIFTPALQDKVTELQSVLFNSDVF